MADQGRVPDPSVDSLGHSEGSDWEGSKERTLGWPGLSNQEDDGAME